LRRSTASSIRFASAPFSQIDVAGDVGLARGAAPGDDDLPLAGHEHFGLLQPRLQVADLHRLGLKTLRPFAAADDVHERRDGGEDGQAADDQAERAGHVDHQRLRRVARQDGEAQADVSRSRPDLRRVDDGGRAGRKARASITPLHGPRGHATTFEHHVQGGQRTLLSGRITLTLALRGVREEVVKRKKMPGSPQAFSLVKKQRANIAESRRDGPRLPAGGPVARLAAWRRPCF
jgi:hypothetical protein